MPMIATTIKSSIREKPCWPFFCCMFCLLLLKDCHLRELFFNEESARGYSFERLNNRRAVKGRESKESAKALFFSKAAVKTATDSIEVPNYVSERVTFFDKSQESLRAVL